MVGKTIFPSYTSDGHLTTLFPLNVSSIFFTICLFFYFLFFFLVSVLTLEPQVVGYPPAWAPR